VIRTGRPLSRGRGRHPLRVAFACLVAAAALASGCGGDDDEPEKAQPLNPPEKTKVPRYAGDPAARKQPKGQGVLERLPKVERATAAAAAPKIKGSSELTVEEFLDTLGNDVATFWQQEFNAAGYRFLPATQVIVTGTVSSGCDPRETISRDTGNAFYCRVDESIFLPLGFMEVIVRAIGDTGVAFTIAHEYGHRVQDLLGILDAADRGRFSGKNLELQADCLAGAWATSVYRRGLLEEGDLEEAARFTSKIADAPGTVADDPRAHGSAQERLSAFDKGYRSGDAGTCLF
jgi:predicted metalloprotease